ncbi:ABC transporter permease [Streptomyces sp. NPDC012935]|uniref:ABC transporter permease n=1 Tax=Streptomyces sp. NPDC012935 TaxID=3364857 RepID=UPI0036B1772E
MPHDLRTLGVIVAHEWRIQRRDWVPQLILTVMPLVLMAFLMPLYRQAMAATAGPSGQGADAGAAQAVPGLSVMFSMFLVSHVGMTFFRDHGWNTWSRYRSTAVPVPLLVLGKTVVPLCVLVAQMTVLLFTGWLLFGLRIRGSLIALALVVLAFALCLAALGVLGFAACRTVVQMTSLANVAALTMAGLGGALVPRELLPDWAVPLAPATPAYWAVRAMRQILQDGAGLGGVAGALGALLLFAAGLGGLAAVLLKPDHRKVSWA